MNLINKLLWSITIVLMILSGIYYTVKLKGIQFKLGNIIKSIKNNDNSKITPFQTLSMTLAGRIGVGSLSGVALSIYLGGEGTILWMWIISFIVCPLSYLESYLANHYHIKINNEYIGGPAFYISRGLNNKKLASLYAVILIITYIFGFLSIQSNTITKSITNLININPIIIGIIIGILSTIIMFRGVDKIGKFLEKLVPIMSITFILASLYILIINYRLLPNLFFRIFNSALNIKSFGFGVISTFIIGIQRGIFCNEAGCGTGSIASASSYSSNSDKQGKIQMFGIYFTTLIICSLTAFVIILSNYNTNLTDINGIEITNYAFNLFLGNIGNIVVLISIILFAFSTIIAGYYYSDTNLKYLTNSYKYNNILKIITIIVLILSSVVRPYYIWNFVDILLAILAIINIYSLYKFRNKL